MNFCIDCDKKLKGHNNPKRCRSCNGVHKSLFFKHSDKSKLKISIAKSKLKEEKKCADCNVFVSSRNKKGLCRSCSKKGNWYVGLKINDLELINHIGRNKLGYEIWNIKCYCGNKFNAIVSKIKIGRIRSCGCLNKEHCIKLGESQKGENNPVWIKDRTKTSCFIRNKDCRRNNKGSWQYFSRKYKKEKHYTCELTNEVMGVGELNVHHIESVVNRPDLVLDRNNLICIKKEIHTEFHKIYGKKTNRKQWDEFVRAYNTAPTLKGAISRFHKFIKGTA